MESREIEGREGKPRRQSLKNNRRRNTAENTWKETKEAQRGHPSVSNRALHIMKKDERTLSNYYLLRP